MVGNNVKHAPGYKNALVSKQSLRKRAHDVNDLGASVSVPDIFLANLDNIDTKEKEGVKVNNFVNRRPPKTLQRHRVGNGFVEHQAYS